jgi:hypothetical protein
MLYSIIRLALGGFMKQVSLLSSLLLLTGIIQAASLQDPVFTEIYYNNVSVSAPSGWQFATVGGINNNGLAVGLQFSIGFRMIAGVIFNANSVTRFTTPFIVGLGLGSVTGINDQGVVVGLVRPFLHTPIMLAL